VGGRISAGAVTPVQEAPFSVQLTGPPVPCATQPKTALAPGATGVFHD